MVTRLFAKVSNKVRDFGKRGAALYIVQWFLRKLPLGVDVIKYFLVAQAVPHEPLTPREHTLRITEISRDDYNYDWFPRPSKFIDMRFEQNAICFVAFSGTTPVASLWLKRGPFREDTVRALFRPIPEEQSVWDFDVFVHPEFRFSRTFMHLWTHAFAWMQDNDVRWTMSRIDAFNKASIQAHQKLGAKIVDQVIFWRIGPLQLSRSYNERKWVLSRSRRPEYPVVAPAK